MKRWTIPFLATLAIAAIVHMAAVWAAPRLIMARTIARMEAHGAHNAAVRPPRPTETSHDVVLPSPDLLYTTCTFDLGERPLRITASVPDTYWSVSFFAANTDNFFVLDDRQAGAPTVDLLLVGPGWHDAAPTGARIIEAPSRRGIVLFRTLVPGDAALPPLIAAQQEQRCAPL